MRANDGLLALFGAICVVTLIAASVIRWRLNRSSKILLIWAERNTLRIIRKEFRDFFKGPFFWSSNQNQAVYYVTVENKRGQRRHGWVRCGSYWWSMFSGQAEVRWDGPWEEADPMRDRSLDG